MRGVLDKALPWLRLKVSQVRMTFYHNGGKRLGRKWANAMFQPPVGERVPLNKNDWVGGLAA
jgi:hypothetical protein